ncbi:MAG TPA: glycerophosphodiester phosphodiesterase [Gemmatimonadaceae bacterium]|nr:glycerophosphodiester phosphodiesterase [Gemmatimonadaceae bacterium]
MEIIAHRGVPRQQPENSLPGFELAVRQKVHGIELDVHATKDGVVVVHHDPNIRHGPLINTLTLTELHRYPLTSGVEIPTLAAVLDRMARALPPPIVYVEVKGKGIEEAVVEVLEFARVPTAVHSFDHRVAARVSSLAPSIPTGILLDSYLVDPAAALRAAGARDYWLQWSFIDRDLVRRVHDVDGRVIAWTVNERTDVVALEALGVDAICSDVAGTFV